MRRNGRRVICALKRSVVPIRITLSADRLGLEPILADLQIGDF
jgi:hypothetical protein